MSFVDRYKRTLFHSSSLLFNVLLTLVNQSGRTISFVDCHVCYMYETLITLLIYRILISNFQELFFIIILTYAKIL
jgi:hypothetical protein